MRIACDSDAIDRTLERGQFSRLPVGRITFNAGNRLAPDRGVFVASGRSKKTAVSGLGLSVADLGVGASLNPASKRCFGDGVAAMEHFVALDAFDRSVCLFLLCFLLFEKNQSDSQIIFISAYTVVVNDFPSFHGENGKGAMV